MYKIALKMLIEDRAKFVGMILSLSLSSIIITQQDAIFNGIMKRTYSMITDTPQPDIWVMDPNTKFVDDLIPLRDTDLYRVRCIEGVKWAVPFFKGTIRARLANGHFESCLLLGIDDATLIGGPHTILEGFLAALRFPNAIIVNHAGATEKLVIKKINKPIVPLRIGDSIELNDQRATVVGICGGARPFHSQPMIYTTYNRALKFSPSERKQLSFILVKADGSISPKALCQKIERLTPFSAHTQDDFKEMTRDYYMKNTGMPINFGIAMLLGLLVGAAIAGQIFYNFVSDNLKYLALFAAMGASRWLLAKMALLQALWVAFIGWGLGSGSSALLGYLSRRTEISYLLTWQLFLGTGITILAICTVALLISIARIFKIELWTMFK